MDNGVCDLCGKRGLFRVVLPNAKGTKWSLVKCPGCGLRFLRPWPTPDELARARYLSPEDLWNSAKAHSGAHHKAFAAQHFARMRNFARWQTGRDLLVYEVGAATGWFLHWLIEAGANNASEGCDPNEAALRAGVMVAFGGRLEAKDFQHATCPGRPYDVVAMNDVVEHMGSPAAALRKAREISQPGTVLYLKTFLEELDEPSGRRMLDPPDHLYHFTRPTLRRLIKEAGFSIQAWEEAVEWPHVTIFALAEE